MKKLGICWDGAEEQLHDLLLASLRDPFHYVEVGVAYLQTMFAIYEWLLEATNGQFMMSGIDLHPIPQSNHLEMLNDSRVKIITGASKESIPTLGVINFAVIDGCHAAPCVTSDFTEIEKKSVSGTVVVFHDFQVSCQGVDFQPHCKQMIGVRSAITELGLTDDTRPGWKRLPDLHGNKDMHGADCGVFQRL